jgi:hypothetical protein
LGCVGEATSIRLGKKKLMIRDAQSVGAPDTGGGRLMHAGRLGLRALIGAATLIAFAFLSPSARAQSTTCLDNFSTVACLGTATTGLGISAAGDVVNAELDSGTISATGQPGLYALSQGGNGSTGSGLGDDGSSAGSGGAATAKSFGIINVTSNIGIISSSIGGSGGNGANNGLGNGGNGGNGGAADDALGYNETGATITITGGGTGLAGQSIGGHGGNGGSTGGGGGGQAAMAASAPKPAS